MSKSEYIFMMLFRIIFTILVVILIIWFSYHQIKLIKTDEKLKELQVKSDEITREYEEIVNSVDLQEV